MSKDQTKRRCVCVVIENSNKDLTTQQKHNAPSSVPDETVPKAKQQAQSLVKQHNYRLSTIFPQMFLTNHFGLPQALPTEIWFDDWQDVEIKEYPTNSFLCQLLHQAIPPPKSPKRLLKSSLPKYLYYCNRVKCILFAQRNLASNTGLEYFRHVQSS